MYLTCQRRKQRRSKAFTRTMLSTGTKCICDIHLPNVEDLQYGCGVATLIWKMPRHNPSLQKSLKTLQPLRCLLCFIQVCVEILPKHYWHVIWVWLPESLKALILTLACRLVRTIIWMNNLVEEFNYTYHFSEITITLILKLDDLIIEQQPCYSPIWWCLNFCMMLNLVWQTRLLPWGAQ